MRVPLLNFEGGPGVLLLNFEGGPGVPLLNFEGGPRFRVPRSLVPGSWSTMLLQSSFNRFEFCKSVHLEIRKGVTKEQTQLNKERKECIYSPENIRKPEVF